jgi:hypothetical protein
MIIKPSIGGHIVEEIKYKERLYWRLWREGEFKIDNIDEQMNSVGDVICPTDSMLRLWDQIDRTELVDPTDEDIEIYISDTDFDFKENSETITYWVVDGFKIIEE